jgi:pimeloyl-ACP methyl ester carboxylesterase
VAGVRLVPVAGAGHDMMQDAPEAFVAALAEAIGAQAAGAQPTTVRT